MLCASCGKELPVDALHCPACGAAKNPTAKPASSGPGVADKIKAASADSFKAFKSFALNPVGELANVYNSLGDTRALAVGITFGVVSAICFTLGNIFLQSHFGRPDGVSWIIKSLLWSCIPFITTTAACFGARSVFHGSGGLPADSFIAGASVLPIALLSLVSGIVGPFHFKFNGALAIFLGCMSVFILFVGFVRIAKLTEKVSTLLVPATILLSLWLSYLIYSELLTPKVQVPAGFNF